jgi:hypothetical protein
MLGYGSDPKDNGGRVMPTSLYWRNKTTGEIYAVRVSDDGVLDGAVGPIPPKDATSAKLRRWEFDPKKGEQLRRRFLEFERIGV